MQYHNQTDPNAALYAARLGWVALSAIGVAVAWVFLQSWPPLDINAKTTCTALLAMPCVMFLYFAVSSADGSVKNDMDAFWRMRACHKTGLPLPCPGTPMGKLYKRMVGIIAVQAACEASYAFGCLCILPWGAAALAMHGVFRIGFDTMKGLRPDLFDGSDPDMAVTALLTEPALDAVIAAFLLCYAWLY